jgi:hypothetical protein
LIGLFSFIRGAVIRGGWNVKSEPLIGIVSVVWKIFLPIKSSCLYSVAFEGGKIGRLKEVHEHTQGLIFATAFTAAQVPSPALGIGFPTDS